ncbi:hypothetical protein [Lysobacter sp. Hz 25]|uniref:hypothetical protein n=1 Tax=Lysobacter sp. Hz 25 TaxID=3383698 RepID=UPI0038D39843
MRTEFCIFSLVLALGVSACGEHKPRVDRMTAELQDKYKRNPAPKQPYQITLTLVDAPGPFAKIEGFVSYEARDCRYMPDRIAGFFLTPSINLPMSYSKVDETSYVATVHADAMLDEDYLGEGICHWQLTSLNAQLKATGAEPETNFIASLMNEDVTAQRAVTNYYWKERYPRSEVTDYPDMGEEDRDAFRPEIRDELFAITLLPRATTP